MLSRNNIRENLIQQRASLSPRQRKINAESLTRRFHQWFDSHFINGSKQLKIAGYLAVRGEIDPYSILAFLRDAGHLTYLPVIPTVKNEKLLFAPVTESTRFKIGKYAIQEPICQDKVLITGEQLDLVLMPLVAVDKNGNRVGMGGGYYDKTFSFKTEADTQTDQPTLLGLCHHFQLLSSVPVEDWDVPLDAVVTDEEIVK